MTSTFKMLRPEDVWHPRVGAPPGNRNRLKHGRYTNECKAIRRRIAAWRRDTRALLARAHCELALREIGRQTQIEPLRRRAAGTSASLVVLKAKSRGTYMRDKSKRPIRPQNCSIAASLLLAAVWFTSPAAADLVVSTDATKHIDCSAGVCTANAQNAVLNVNDVETKLASGDLEISTGGSIASDLTISAAISWTSASKLTLLAYRNIAIRRPISVAGTGALDLESNRGSGVGTLSFGPNGNATFFSLNGTLTIIGKPFKLFDRISTIAAAVTSNPVGSYALAKSYDASTDGTYSTSPIRPFAGVFEGLGNTISNLKINDPVVASGHSVGLFQRAEPGSIIRHLNLAKVSITGADNAVVGAIAGYASGSVRFDSVTGRVKTGSLGYAGGLVGDNEGTVQFSHSDVLVKSSADQAGLGGIAAGNNGTIDQSDATGDVTAHGAEDSAGGLVGYEISGSITASRASGAVTATDSNTSVGGLVGLQTGGTISTSYATGTVSASGSLGVAGGLVGTASSSSNAISQCFASGAVSAAAFAGGLIGRNEAATISDSYARGAVSGSADGGGFAGLTESSVSTSYSTGKVTTTGITGGFVGDDYGGTLASNYWDETTSGITDSSKGAGNVVNAPGIKGRSNANLKAALPSGFSSSVWGRQTGINGGLPYLLAVPPP